MRVVLALVLCLSAASAVWAQRAQNGAGAVLRGLDKITDQTQDMTLRPGESASFGHITVTLQECRYPAGNPAGDAYAHVTVDDRNSGQRVFSGWMIASSPALSAREHPRYEVWVLSCKTY